MKTPKFHILCACIQFAGTIAVLLTTALPLYAEKPGAAYYDFGVFAYEDGDFEDALQNLKKALTYAPYDPETNHYLGKTYLKLERYKEALQSFNRAWSRDPELSGLRYDMAVTHYKLKDYPIATYLFAEEAKENPQNVLARYYLGNCYFQRGRYQKASVHFLKAAEANPTIKPNAYFFAALCDIKLEQFEAAAQKFEVVSESALDEGVRSKAQQYLRQVRLRERSLSRLRLYAKISGQYDDNVPQEPMDQDLFSQEDDYLLTGYFTGSYHLLRDKGAFLSIGYNHYQSSYTDLTEYNLTGSTPNLTVTYSSAPLVFKFFYAPTYYWLDNEDYMLRHQVKQDITWKMNPDFSSRLSFNYHTTNNFSNSGRSGRTLGMFIDTIYLMTKQNSSFLAGAGFEDNSATGHDYSYQQWTGKIGGTIGLPLDLALSFTAKYDDKRYTYIDSAYGVQRTDQKYTISSVLSRSVFADWLSAELGYTYTRNNASIDAYAYQRNLFSVALVGKY